MVPHFLLPTFPSLRRSPKIVKKFYCHKIVKIYVYFRVWSHAFLFEHFLLSSFARRRTENDMKLTPASPVPFRKIKKYQPARTIDIFLGDYVGGVRVNRIVHIINIK